METTTNTGRADAIDEAEASAVLADEAEQAGDEGRARLLSRVAGSQYERAARLAEAVSLDMAARRYRLAQTAYRRGGSNGKAFRMGCRAEKCEAYERAATQEERNRLWWMLSRAV